MGLFNRDEDEINYAIGDSGGGSMPAPEVKPPPPPSGPEAELMAMRLEQENSDRTKGYLGAAGSVLDNFANAPSAYELFYNKKSDRAKPSDVIKRATDAMGDPMSKEAKAMEYMKQKREGKLSADADDSNSEDSLALAEQIGGAFPQYAQFVKGKSARQIKEMMPILSQKIRGDQDRDNARISAGERNADRKERADERKEVKTNQYVEKLQNKLTPLQEINTSLSGVENKMGFTLDEYDPETNKAKGKAVDLPGISVPGLGRIKFYSGDARSLDNAMTKVFNVELKDRSGAAVTTPELARLRDEFSEGKFNTESEKIAALKEYKRLAGLAMKNVEAGYDPAVVATYQDRGGMTSQSVSKGQRSIVKKFEGSDGSMKIVYTDGTEEIIPSTAGR